MEQYQLWWPEERSEWERQGMLLLVAVEPAAGAELPERALPCRVVGTLSPGTPPFPAPGKRSETPRPDVAQRAAQLLSAVGVPTNLLGCVYLRTALQLLQEQPQMRRGMMRTLYPLVAQRHGVTAGSVERAIRHAICQTWARGGAERYRQLLGRMGSSVGDRPTNSEFITLMADRLALGQRTWPDDGKYGK